MAKGKKDDAKKPTITAVSTSLASKMDHRERQDTREAKKNQPNARPAQKTGRPASPLAAALTPAAGIAAAIANIVAPFVA